MLETKRTSRPPAVDISEDDIDAIISAVAEFAGIRDEVLKYGKRRKEHVEGRHLAFYIIYTVYGQSREFAGKVFNYCGSTALKAVQGVRARLENEDEYAERAQPIIDEFRSRVKS